MRMAERLGKFINKKVDLEFGLQNLEMVTGTLIEIGDDYLILAPSGCLEGNIIKKALYPLGSIIRLAGHDEELFD